ncbi:MAG: hypothetical protein ABI681_03080 [Gemmatimonadales bacterium]
MHIELIDLLRCPREHEETWLVAAFQEMRGRFAVTGKLGCPVCAETYLIEAGVVDMRIEAGTSPTGPTRVAEHFPHTDPDSGEAMRIAAMLGLVRPGLLVILTGETTAVAHELSELADAHVLALNPPSQIEETERVATVLVGSRLPVGASSTDGVIIGEAGGGEGMIAEASRVLKPGGRLVVPAHTSLPPQFRELASDDRNAVAETIGPLIGLSR